MIEEMTVPADEIDERNELYWVAIYLIDLAYGGSEEGGWWYQAGALVSDPDLHRAIGQSPSSVVCRDGATMALKNFEGWIGKVNESRPHQRYLIRRVFMTPNWRQRPMGLYCDSTHPRKKGFRLSKIWERIAQHDEGRRPVPSSQTMRYLRSMGFTTSMMSRRQTTS
jgi:hypothetical protein